MRVLLKAVLVFAAIAPLLTAGVAIDYVHGQATKSQGGEVRGVVPPDSFGQATADIVCGDKLCSEVEEKDGPETMKFKAVDVYPLSGDSYKVLIRVTAPANDYVQNEILTVTSDLDKNRILVPFVGIDSRDYFSTILKVDSLDSISIRHADEGIAEDKPSVTVLDVSPIGFKEPAISDVSPTDIAENLYRVTFEVFAGNSDLSMVSIGVQSDAESFITNISGIFEGSSQTQQILVKASNPDSISVHLRNYQAST